MEAAGLGLGSLIIIILVMMYYGIFGSVETVARMGNKELLKLEDEQSKRHDEWYVENQLDVDTAVKAAESRAYYRAIREGRAIPAKPTTKAKA